MEARCSRKPLRRGSKKTFKTCVIFGRLWDPNAVLNGAQHRIFFEVFGVPGPVWAHRTLRVDSESQNGAQEVKMGGKVWSNGIKMMPIVASTKGAHYPLCSNMLPRGVLDASLKGAHYPLHTLSLSIANCGFGCLLLKSYNATRRTGGIT